MFQGGEKKGCLFPLSGFPVTVCQEALFLPRRRNYPTDGKEDAPRSGVVREAETENRKGAEAADGNNVMCAK